MTSSIEQTFPLLELNQLAEQGSHNKHFYRPSTYIHKWWARRPLAACQAVLCTALWPDPLDEHCPQSFRDAAAILCDFADKVRFGASLS